MLAQSSIEHKREGFVRTDSCRRCGSELKTNQKCSKCSKPIKFRCTNCRFETDEQIHLNCVNAEKECKLLDTGTAR